MEQPTVPAGWQIHNSQGINKLRREFFFTDFQHTLDFVVAVGQAAEVAGHHPRIELGWGKAMVEWWTHSAKGLTDKDFQMAAQTNEIFKAQS